ncbi:MAG: CTP synthase [Erysipelotrichaceae bacterium]
MAKFIFVTGGVVSGIGKGLAAASIGNLLKARGLRVFIQKFDPYLNVDPGTMSPYQHGEVFVTKDGAETDLDLGHYERFIDEELTQDANITTGKIYNNIIEKERRGGYLGATIQVIPHVTDEIKRKVYGAAESSNADVVITEIGGTAGDIESLPFLEAIRQIHRENERDDVVYVHTTLIPKIPGSGEYKTKPTQHSTKVLMENGIKANILILRSEEPVEQAMKEKLAMFCDVNIKAIVESLNVDNLYELPLIFKAQGLDDYILHKLNLNCAPADLLTWKAMIEKQKNLKSSIKIGLVGKYVHLHDSYISVYEALKHAGLKHDVDVEITWIDSEAITEENVGKQIKGLQGIIVPGGFGGRGIPGMQIASRYCRHNNIPYFGICLGMQIALVDIARELGVNADSTEWNSDTKEPIIDLMKDQSLTQLGGTLRLGNWNCHLSSDSKVSTLYGTSDIVERHRHRYEFNNDYKNLLAKAGVKFVGINQERDLVEIIELANHPFFVACQFHPEFKSRPNRAHPLFDGFVNASKNYK